MKQPTMMAFKMFRTHKRTDFMLGVQPIYTRLDTPAIARVPEPGPATETFNALKANWATDAQRLCFPSVPRPSFTLLSEKKKEEFRKNLGEYADAMSRLPVEPADHFPRKFMFQGSHGTTYNNVLPSKDTEIQAVEVKTVAGNVPARSRLNLVVLPECTGPPLFHKLLAVSLILTNKSSSSSGAIIDWKVMSPKLGAESRESAVIYLSEPLADAKVQHVIIVLSAFLHSDLVALKPCPVGLIEITHGIYGVDLPDENTEKHAFNNNMSDSSFGRLMAMIMCKAGWQAATNICHGNDAETNRKHFGIKSEQDEENYLRTHLESVVGELGWKLED
jgi:hypothetical protein